MGKSGVGVADPTLYSTHLSPYGTGGDHMISALMYVCETTHDAIRMCRCLIF